MNADTTFSTWFKRRRKLLGLKQLELANIVSCSVVMIRKIEAGERRASPALAERLADALEIAANERSEFIRAATGHSAAPLIVWHTKTNLPAQLTNLIGRDREIKELRAAVVQANSRIFTLTGPGGIGKTRLAMHVASTLLDTFEDGVFFVSLASVQDPELVPVVMTESLGLSGITKQTASGRLIDELRDKNMLLVLDNFEQITPAALLISRIIKYCLWVTILVTSREPLHIQGEQQIQVPPLTTPPQYMGMSMQEALNYSAVALFVNRAQQINTNFQLTDAMTPTVARLCTRLDGLPLAIELVAAHSNVLSPEALLARLTSRLALLKDGPRDISYRHQTIRATIEWSFDLLSPEEQAVFRWLGTFSGGWSLEAAEALCDQAAQHFFQPNDNPLRGARVIEILTALINKSMIIKQELLEGEKRFRMLETIREYALEQLLQRGERDVLEHVHAQYYISISDMLHRELAGPDRDLWTERVSQEQENLRRAFSWALNNGSPEIALQIGEILWFYHMHLSEALAQTRAANQLLDKQVAERTASLEQALALLKERENHLSLINEQLLKAKMEAEQANQFKTQFFANISHELHTTLNVIINFTMFMGDEDYGALNETQQGFQSRVLVNSDYLLGLINDMLDLSRLEMGQLELVKEPFDMYKVLHEAVETINARVQHRPLDVSLQFQDTLPAALGDRARIRQIVLNLLGYIHRLSPIGKVSLSGWVDEIGMIYCSVQEVGIEAQRNLVPMQLITSTLSTALPPAYRSISLGLSVSSRIIELHQGQIWAGSTHDGLTCFLFCLPATSMGYNQ